ncbi:MAG: FG-GAP-like repeat-containing protein [Gemmatimonadota bacterium]
MLLPACAARPTPARVNVADSGSADTTPLGTFERTLQLETTSETSANVSIGDLNSDGNPDLVLAKGRHWPLVDRVLFGDGRGHFPTAFDLGTASDRSYSGLLVDLDGDGDLDVVISNDKPDPKRTYLNDGTGHFVVGSTFGHPEWSTRNASVADLNGDGHPDIVVANRSGRARGTSYICLNDGHGHFPGDCLPFSEESSTTITPADFNGDGKMDLAVPNRDGGQSFVYLHDAEATAVRFRKIPFGRDDATIREAQAADLDGDGALDLVAIDEQRGVTLYFGDGSGAFSTGTPLDDGTATPYALALGDLNGDGRVDVIVGHVEAPTTIHFNDGSGRHFRAVTVGDGRGTVYGFAIGDLDGDGLADLAAARSQAPNMVYFGARNPASRVSPPSRPASSRPTPP